MTACTSDRRHWLIVFTAITQQGEAWRIQQRQAKTCLFLQQETLCRTFTIWRTHWLLSSSVLVLVFFSQPRAAQPLSLNHMFSLFSNTYIKFYVKKILRFLLESFQVKGCCHWMSLPRRTRRKMSTTIFPKMSNLVKQKCNKHNILKQLCIRVAFSLS